MACKVWASKVLLCVSVQKHLESMGAGWLGIGQKAILEKSNTSMLAIESTIFTCQSFGDL